MIIGSEIGKRFKGVSLDTSDADDSNKAAMKYAKMVVTKEIGGLILQGPVGSGKSHIALAILQDVEKDSAPKLREVDGLDAYLRGTVNAYWKAPDLADAVKAAVSDKSSRRPAKDAKEADLLVIDDLGTEYEKPGSDFIYCALQSIFDYRWENELPIVITTNLEPTALAKRYGDRVLSRWRGSCKMLALKGEDRRKEG